MELSPQMEKSHMEPKVEEEGGGKWREDQAPLRAQTAGWWYKCPPHTFSSQHPKLYSIPMPVPESILPGLCKMRWKTWRGGSKPERGWSWGLSQ